MAGIDLINNLENISPKIPSMILILEGFILTENHRENLKNIIFRDFSNSKTHPIEKDLEKKVINFSNVFTNFKICKRKLKLNFLF